MSEEPKPAATAEAVQSLVEATQALIKAKTPEPTPEPPAVPVTPTEPPEPAPPATPEPTPVPEPAKAPEPTPIEAQLAALTAVIEKPADRKSTRLNSSHRT